MIYSDGKGGQQPGKEEVPDGKCCVEERSAPKVLQEHREKQKSAKSMLRSSNVDWGGSTLAEEHQKRGGGGGQ